MGGLDGVVCVCIMRVMVVFIYIHMWYVYLAMMVLSTKNGRSQHIRHGGKKPGNWCFFLESDNFILQQICNLVIVDPIATDYQSG